ncbi:probable protein phosphatase 2C 55 [Abrus precatorius]|uniref:Protein phosphatase n=1 Tax=Abrus precatorius TaxID=3816 RepID=A0A8B8JGG1_ABRPR|nr:probable protein phosphatase 2C 55 [Abrus precatorius]
MPSNYFSRFGTSIRRSVVGKEGGIGDSAEVLIGQGKFWFGRSKFFHSVNNLSSVDLRLIVRSGVALASSSESVGRRRTLSVVDTLSRTFSVPSVSGPSFQVCGYHIGCALAGPDQFSTGTKVRIKTMAAHMSRVVVGEYYLDNSHLKCNHHLLSTKNCSNICLSTSLRNGGKVSMSLKNHWQPDNRAFHGYFIYNVAKTWCSSHPYMQSGCGDFHSSSTSCYSVGPAHDVPFDTSARDEQLTKSADSAEQKTPSGKALKLISGSCYLPHPDKEETGGEDAHFICSEEQAIGVADGVGGWADLGVNAGYYSRELMSKSVDAIQEEPKGSIDPARVLEKAHSSTKAKGSSTACIIALTDQGLHAINLGDSGFMVVRDGCTIFRSPVQQHDFNFTYQLECGSNGDLPSSGQVFTIPVAPGDVIVAGTDGLFDNLYNNEITAVVVHAIRAGLSPQVTAQKIAALARQRALDKDRQTPFSTAAQDAGFRYYGGKLDDTTVVVSYIGSGDA